MAQTHIEQHDQTQQRCWLMELIEDTFDSKNTNRVHHLLFSLVLERTKIQLLVTFVLIITEISDWKITRLIC